MSILDKRIQLMGYYSDIEGDLVHVYDEDDNHLFSGNEYAVMGWIKNIEQELPDYDDCTENPLLSDDELLFLQHRQGWIDENGSPTEQFWDCLDMGI